MSDDITTDLACKELVEIITDYLEGTLPQGDRREYVAQMHTTLRLTGRLTVESISPGARDELLRAFRRMKTSSTGL